MAMIDIYHDEIAMALESRDDKWIARIAETFVKRCHWYLPWCIERVTHRICPTDGMQVVISIMFRDGTPGEVCVGYRSGKRRITLNSDRVGAESAHDVIHVLKVPCCFFDGIYYAAEGFTESAKKEVMAELKNNDSAIGAMRRKYDLQYKHLQWLNRSIAKANTKLASARKELDAVMESVRVAGEVESMTIAALDWTSRMDDASNSYQYAEPAFVSLNEARKLISGKSGIYFGWRVTDGKCVYVGKSSDLGSRLHKGRTELLDCKISYIEMPEEQIHTWELFYIWLHHPERNIQVRMSDEAAAAIREEGAIA